MAKKWQNKMATTGTFFRNQKKKVPKTSTSKNAHENDQRFWKMALDLD